jgi:predicted AlkP superfamily pyrophosphatase or phosphodiesterase
LPKRVLVVAVAAVVVAALGAYAIGQIGGSEDEERVLGPTLDAMSDAIGGPVMEHVRRGHVPGRSAEVFLVPKPHYYLAGQWDMTTLGTNTPWTSTAHPSPWAYTARVPLIFNGPNVPKGEVLYDEVDIASVAPTYAEILGVDGLEAEAPALSDIVTGNGLAYRQDPPNAILSIVLDGGGWNVLQKHPDSWPAIKKLADTGTSYVNATIGSAPSITGALHATFGTGVYPRTHGLPGNQMRSPEGENVDTWLENADGRYLQAPAVSELWDEQNDNKPLVGTVSYEGWHLGMIGQGALREGGDKDVAVLWDHENEGWWVNEEYYTLPKVAQTTDMATLERYEEALDGRDGLEDGDWFNHTLEELQDVKVRPGTPAFVKFTGDISVETMRETKVGVDSLTDLFWIEMKMPDFAGHQWNMEFAEQEDVLRETDRQVARFVKQVKEQSGNDFLVMISADHGQQPLPDYLGGWRINTDEVQKDVEREFGNVVEKVTTTDLFMDMDAVDRLGVDLDEVSRWLGAYTIGDNVPTGAPGSDRVPSSRRDDTLFAGVFSTGYLQDLTDEDIESFGDSDYEEGDYTIEPGGE